VAEVQKRRTVKDMEVENQELRDKLKVLETTDDNSELIKTKEALAHSKESEARLMADIEKMEAEDSVIVDGQIVGNASMVFTPTEYAAWCKQNGTIMGRKPGEKTKATIEELRAYINSGWTPSMFMEKHGLSAEDFKQLVWKLSKREMRDRPIRYSIERDTISKEA